MARIIHVSNFGQKAKGAFQHNVGHKITNGLVRNGHFVSNFSDRDVARAGSWFGYRKLGVPAANKALHEFCRNVRPDLLLLGHADIIRPETLRAIRQDMSSIKIVQWNVDPVFEQDNINRIRTKLGVVDATLVSTAGEALAPLVSSHGGVLGFLPNPVDFSIETGRNYEKAQLPYDLFYACGNPLMMRFTCGKDWLPEDLIQQIESGVPGVRTRLTSLRGFPQLAGAAYQEALESAAIGLNLSRRGDYYLYSSDRLAHMCGNGMAILMERSTGYDQYFSDDEFVFYSTIDELTQKVRRLLQEPAERQAIAKAGRERYHALFNEQIVARYITEVAFGLLRPSDYTWPTLFYP